MKEWGQLRNWIRHHKCIFDAPVPPRFDTTKAFLHFKYSKRFVLHFRYSKRFVLHFRYRKCTFHTPVLPRFVKTGVLLHFKYRKYTFDAPVTPMFDRKTVFMHFTYSKCFFVL